MHLLKDRVTNSTYLWSSDLHLDEDRFSRLESFLNRSFHDHLPQAFFITGDISDAGMPIPWLQKIQVGVPCYFVLGNHDYYRSSIRHVRHLFKEAEKELQEMKKYYLPSKETVFVSDDTAVIGVDGWSDGRAGDIDRSTVYLRDWSEIEDFTYTAPDERRALIEEISDGEIAQLLHKLQRVPSHVRKVIILTHVPPFREACLWKGEVANDQWAPHFISHNMGLMLSSFFSSMPHLDGIVLCGHSHHRATFQPLSNLRVEAAAPFLSAELEFLPQIEL